MIMCKELTDAIETVCTKYNLSNELRNMIIKLIENNMDDPIKDEDIPIFVEKMVVTLED